MAQASAEAQKATMNLYSGFWLNKTPEKAIMHWLVQANQIQLNWPSEIMSLLLIFLSYISIFSEHRRQRVCGDNALRTRARSTVPNFVPSGG